MSAILREEPRDLSSMTATPIPVPPGLARLVHRCLQKKPEDRFQSASDLGIALERLSVPEALSSRFGTKCSGPGICGTGERQKSQEKWVNRSEVSWIFYRVSVALPGPIPLALSAPSLVRLKLPVPAGR